MLSSYSQQVESNSICLTVGRYTDAEVARIMGVSEAVVAEDLSMGQSFKMDWLRTTFERWTDSEVPAEAEMAARAYLLYTFGCSLLTDKSGNRVPASWLEFITDLSQVGSYAWGAAVLACLYRHLRQASLFKTQ